MATTYQRIRTALSRANQKKSWSNLAELRDAIRKSKPDEFIIDGEVLKEKTVDRILQLMIDLGVLVQRANQSIDIPASSRTALESDDKFSRKVQSGVRSYLERCGVEVGDMISAIRGIKYPDTPDAETIYSCVYSDTQESTRQLTLQSFTRLLYLYACANGIRRKVRIHYEE